MRWPNSLAGNLNIRSSQFFRHWRGLLVASKRAGKQRRANFQTVVEQLEGRLAPTVSPNPLTSQNLGSVTEQDVIPDDLQYLKNLLGQQVVFMAHHADPGHVDGGDPHFLLQQADGHHIAWEDQDPSTPTVIDILYDFRTLAGLTNVITPGQIDRVVDAFHMWENATNGLLHFTRSTTALDDNIIIVGTGDAGPCSVQLGIAGLSDWVHDANTHRAIRGFAIMNSNCSWNETFSGVGGGDGFHYLAVAAQEIGHALGLGHFGSLGDRIIMNPNYCCPQTITSADDNIHIRALYNNVIVAAAGGQAGDGTPDSFRVVRSGSTLNIFTNGSTAYTSDIALVTIITLNGSSDADTLTVDTSGGAIGRPMAFNGAGGTDQIESTADVDFTLCDSRLTNSSGDSVTLTAVERASLIGGPSSNSFLVSGWTRNATLDGGSSSDLVITSNNSSFTLSDGSLVVGGGGSFALSNFVGERAMLTGGGSANVFAVSGWTGSATLDGGAGSDQVVSSNKPGFILGANNLTVIGGGSFGLTSIDLAVLPVTPATTALMHRGLVARSRSMVCREMTR